MTGKYQIWRRNSFLENKTCDIIGGKEVIMFDYTILQNNLKAVAARQSFQKNWVCPVIHIWIMRQAYESRRLKPWDVFQPITTSVLMICWTNPWRKNRSYDPYSFHHLVQVNRINSQYVTVWSLEMPCPVRSLNPPSALRANLQDPYMVLNSYRELSYVCS